MKLSLFHKIIAVITVVILIFCIGLFVGKAKSKVVLNVIITNDSAKYSTEIYENDNANLIVDINTADKETLMLLPMINETIAEHIISTREARGGFSDISEIKDVLGINLYIWLRIKSHIII